MSDLIERQDAIDELKKISFSHWFECGEYLSEDTREIEIISSSKALEVIEALPSAQSDLVTWLLDTVWDEDMWELNWQAFPELLCRKLEKLGYVKRKGDEYERLDKQTGCDCCGSRIGIKYVCMYKH